MSLLTTPSGILLMASLVLGAAGALMAVICLILTIIRAIMKKRVKLTVILMLVGILLFIACVFGFFAGYKGLGEEQRKMLNRQKSESAETAADGTITFHAGEFSFKDDSGNTFDNSTLAQYKYTIINHWEPWCVPCKKELPDLEKIYEEYKDKGINMVGIYCSTEDAAQVIADNGLTYATVCIGDDATSGPFGVFESGGVPDTYVLDSEGRLVAVGAMGEESQKAMAGENPTEEVRALYDGVVVGARTYDYWKGKLDALLK